MLSLGFEPSIPAIDRPQTYRRSHGRRNRFDIYLVITKMHSTICKYDFIFYSSIKGRHTRKNSHV